MKRDAILRNQDGTIMVVALLILLLLTLQGIATINSSSVDVKIVGNEKRYFQDFYVADSGWREGLDWLDTKAFAPQLVNQSVISNSKVVRNYGGVNISLIGNDEEKLPPANDSDNSVHGIPYWYKIEEERVDKVAGSGPENLKFVYRVDSAAREQGRQRIEVFLTKIYKTGYN